MNYDEQAPLKLTAMTLHGVGSYLGGARLDIHPLTILCGTNGSGKSTWLKTLELLRRSSGLLPFAFDAEDEMFQWEFTNGYAAVYADGQVGHIEPVVLPGTISDFGPLGTVGVEFESTKPFSFSGKRKDPSVEENSVDAFIRTGHCQAKTRIQIRIAHLPETAQDGLWKLCRDYFELVVDDAVIQFWRTADDEAYQLWTNLSSTGMSDQMFKLGRVQFSDEATSDLRSTEALVRCVSEATNDAGRLRELALNCVERIQQVLEVFGQGFFYVSAFRVPHRYTNLREVVKYDENACCPVMYVPDPRLVANQPELKEFKLDRRYVGQNGEATFAMEQLYAYSPMEAIGWEPPQTSQWYGEDTAYPLVVGSYISFWLDKLTDVEIALLARKGEFDILFGFQSREVLSGPIHWYLSESGNKRVVSNCFLTHDKPELHSVFGSGVANFFTPNAPDINTPSAERELDPTDVSRFRHPCFGNSDVAPPARLSAGFHQVAPIVVQAAIMLRGELFGLENPEVHLHPSMQLEVAEYLMLQAAAGRTIIVETHSDLIIRRIIREILEERIPLGQESVRIYFTDLEQHCGYWRYSKLTPLSVNDSGQIENWPEGFLADDINESTRLFDVMYGILPDDEDSDERE